MLLFFDDLIYIMSYFLKALSNFTHESVLKTERQANQQTDQVSPRSDFPSLKKLKKESWKNQREITKVGGPDYL